MRLVAGGKSFRFEHFAFSCCLFVTYPVYKGFQFGLHVTTGSYRQSRKGKSVQNNLELYSKLTNRIFNCHIGRLTTVLRFLLSCQATLDACHCPVARQDALQAWTKALPNQPGVEQKHLFRRERPSVWFFVPLLAWKCRPVPIKLPSQQLASKSRHVFLLLCFFFLAAVTLCFHHSYNDTDWLCNANTDCERFKMNIKASPLMISSRTWAKLKSCLFTFSKALSFTLFLSFEVLFIQKMCVCF